MVENEPPVDLNVTGALVLSENQPVGTVVGDPTAIDPEEELIVFIDKWSWRRIE